jgi:hypothetical protein
MDMTTTETAIIQTSRLRELEADVERHVSSFAAAGRALREIRDEKLYLGDHKTFEAYCKERWGYAKTHAYRLIDASAVVDRMVDKTSPTGDKLSTVCTVNHAIELAKAPEDEQADVWEEVVTTTAKPTAAAIKGVVERRKAAGVNQGQAKAETALAEVKPPKEKVYRHDAPMPEYYYDDNKKAVPVELYPVWRRKNDYLMIADNPLAMDACDRLLTLGRELNHQTTIEVAETLRSQIKKLLDESRSMVLACQPSVAFDDGTWTSKPEVL